ncbi:ABC transporter [Thermosipho sp. 1063]|uniref:ABC-F family ATP-binding cassette domain-containing protein n=1 Tax=unclassified Thermosipho (in: thermotogales) TaxID=2676525 RepID=UPI0009492566|nr:MULTISPECIES: ABC-F family ATP-binding cassette domain-containing protein [unclassified Thermosipho (in: thermotogales)]ANQ53675.1 ABC transporter [Thermosipho sp. 1070]APT72121.1 ABC transporter [Thermosipho sp. 1063]OOC43366.1 ABC transporter [Thermosipho sp. 1074]
MIALNNVSIHFPGKELLNNVTLNIADGERVALIGKNGSGKTTLLKAIIGEFKDYAGQINTTGKAVYLDQYRTFNSRTPYEYYLEVADTPEKQRLVRSILKGLGFAEEDWHRDINTFSGGEKTRLHIGRIFLEDADFILLDEPTNFLDIPGIHFLKNLLKNFRGGYIIISHDRSFLRDTCERFLEINNSKIWDFRMNFDNYLRERETLILNQKRSMKNKQREIERLKKIIERYRKWGREKFIKQAKSKEKMLQRMLGELQSEVTFEEDVEKEVSIPIPEPSGYVVLSVDNLKFLDILEDVSFKVYTGEKVAILGPNGSGKSTILKLLAGRLKGEGVVEFGHNVKVEFLDQFVENLDEENTVFEELSDEMSFQPDYIIRAYAGKFGFKGEDVFKNVFELSGGERQILALAKVLLKRPNLLVLDEPTNHMDLETVEALEKALKEYKGSLILVSHDEELIKNVCSRYYMIKNRRLVEVSSDFEISVEKKVEKKSPNFEYEQKKKIKNQLKKAKEEIKKLRGMEEKLLKKLELVEIELFGVGADYVKAMELTEKKESLENEIMEILEKIETLEEEIKYFQQHF